jgi:serine/threonine protein kinase
MDVRRRLTEDESRIILKQIVIGLRDINKGKVIHRDMKLANILLHFPGEDLLTLKKEERKQFLKGVNLVETPFEIKISDFGFAKAKNLPGENREHSICGTPAYMAPD